MQTEDLIVRLHGPVKFDMEIKSDWLLICFTFVTKSPGMDNQKLVLSLYLLPLKHPRVTTLLIFNLVWYSLSLSLKFAHPENDMLAQL